MFRQQILPKSFAKCKIVVCGPEARWGQLWRPPARLGGVRSLPLGRLQGDQTKHQRRDALLPLLPPLPPEPELQDGRG